MCMVYLLRRYQSLKQSINLSFYRSICSYDLTTTVKSTGTTNTSASTCSNVVGSNDIIGIAMSGGIDSAMTAYYLTQQYSKSQCIGIYMKNWDLNDETSQPQCSISQDWLDMKQICTRLGIQAIEVSIYLE